LDEIVRVSQRGDREGDSFRSPDQQHAIIARWAEANNATITARHEAIDVSGKTMDRADIDAAVARIRAGESDGIIVAWLDRFSRAPVAEALRVYEDIAAAGGRVIAVDMAGLDPRDPSGELALTLNLGVNRMQWRRAQERWRMSQADAVRAGKAIGGAPFGYRFRDPTPRPRGVGVLDSRLVVEPGEAGVVRELFERKIGGATWLELARFLDLAAPRADGRTWSRQTVQGMIRNRTYLGEVRFGEHHRADAHEAIVSPSVWRRAQPAPSRRTPRGSYLLTGLVRCAGCGWRMLANSGGREGPRVYACPTLDCPAKSTVLVHRLDEEVVRQFFEHLEDFSVREATGGTLETARALVAERTAVVERLAAVVPSHPAAVAAHQEALRAAERELEEAEDALAGAAPVAGPEAGVLREDWPGLTLPERRTLIGAGVDAVLVRRARSRGAPHRPISERVLVLFAGDAPEGLLEPRGLTGWAWDDDPGSLRPVS
jgi:DNA invertase Pin-like site-specific DNA recombinase